jgi:Protein of unknown function (DUF3016)
MTSMKTIRLFSTVLGLAAASALHAADSPKGAIRTDVIFDHPENFTDVKDSDLPSDKGRDEILSRIRSYLVSRTASLVPEGDRLTITFTDIDLAGDFEPGRGPQWSDVRIIKAIYPPAFKFTYSVTDASGRVVKQGTEDIRDMNFQTRVTLDSSDSLHYEKDILDDWARSTLRDLRKG